MELKRSLKFSVSNPLNTSTRSQAETSGFDGSAAGYDEEFTYSAIGQLQRERVYRTLLDQNIEKRAHTILEINCGTGADAIWLAKKGNMVIASDASAKMIEQCQNKQSKLSTPLHLEFKQVAFNGLKTQFERQQFDLIFSNFGGLNCLDEVGLEQLLADLSGLLSKNGTLVVVVMGRKCLWERFYFIFKGQFNKAFRRLSKKAIAANLGAGNLVSTYYYSPEELCKLASPDFKKVNLIPIGFFLPPSYLERFFSKKKVLLKVLYFFEKVIYKWNFLADYADHYLLVLTKKT